MLKQHGRENGKTYHKKLEFNLLNSAMWQSCSLVAFPFFSETCLLEFALHTSSLRVSQPEIRFKMKNMLKPQLFRVVFFFFFCINPPQSESPEGSSSYQLVLHAHYIKHGSHWRLTRRVAMAALQTRERRKAILLRSGNNLVRYGTEIARLVPMRAKGSRLTPRWVTPKNNANFQFAPIGHKGWLQCVCFFFSMGNAAIPRLTQPEPGTDEFRFGRSIKWWYSRCNAEFH